MRFSVISAAVAVFLPALVSAHVSLYYPESVYTHHDGTDLNPLDPSGSNYPCFYTDGGTGTFPELALGSQQHIGLKGSAVHGGGSCQISITYDVPPNKNSKFKVVKSFEGNCPIHAEGNLPDNPTNTLPGLQYQLPSNIPSGKAVIVWTWFNKIGNREMYMRCAPVTLTGSGGDDSAFNALPDMFKANIGNGCGTTEGVDLSFPNPGSVVEGSGDGPPTGNCGPSNSQPEVVKPPKVDPTPTPTPPSEQEQPKDTSTPTLPDTEPPTTTEESTPVETTPKKKYPEHYTNPTETPSPTTDDNTDTPGPSGEACVDGVI